MEPFSVAERPGPVIATAIHAGHSLRADTAAQIALGDMERQREEDPHTERIADIGATQVTVHSSRFEVDLNRARSQALYRTPEQAWGLQVWRTELSPASAQLSLQAYDQFYEEMQALIERTISAHGYALILDVHSYNHRRGGPGAQPENPEANPEVNLGTGTLDRTFWSPVIEPFTASLVAAGFDVRENVKFKGGNFARWVHETFPETAVALAVEFKKTFMDEWSAEVDERAVGRANDALRAAAAVATASLAETMLP